MVYEFVKPRIQLKGPGLEAYLNSLELKRRELEEKRKKLEEKRQVNVTYGAGLIQRQSTLPGFVDADTDCVHPG